MSLPATLTTGRLRLRAWSRSDAEARRAALDASDAHLRPWIPFMKHEPRSLEDTRAILDQYAERFEAGLDHCFGVWADQTLVGGVMLMGERGPPEEQHVGYWLHVDHCGHGYVTEALEALMKAGHRHLGARRFRLRCDERNRSSIAVAQRLGAHFDTHERLDVGVLLEHWVFELT